MKEGQEHMRRSMGMGDLLKNGPLFDLLAGMGQCDDPNCPICGKAKAEEGKSKDEYHLIGEAKLVGAKAEAEYLQKSVSQLVDKRVELTDKLEASGKENQANIEEIEGLCEKNRDLYGQVRELEGSNSRQQGLIKEISEKLTKSRKTAQARKETIATVVAILGDMTAKLTKPDCVAILHRIKEIVTAPPEPEQQAQAEAKL